MEKVFLEVLNMSLASSVLILVVCIARLLLKKAPKWISCVLWGLVAVRLICPVSIESALSLLPSAEPVPADIAMMRKPSIDSGISAVNQVINPVIERNFTPTPIASANPLQIVLFMFSIVWITGIVALGLYAIISYALLYRKVRGSITFKDNIKQCDYIETPFIFGIVRPSIYIPSGITQEQFYHVIAHEKAHLKRLDHVWKPLGFLALVIHWFNPLVWVSYVMLCKDIEIACDEKVISDMNKKNAISYSQTLLECSVGRKNILMCPLAFGEVSVKERVKHVLHYKKPGRLIACIALIACVVVAMCFLTNPKEHLADETQDRQNVLHLGDKSFPYGDVSNTRVRVMGVAFAPCAYELDAKEKEKLHVAINSSQWTLLTEEVPSPDGESYIVYVKDETPYRIIFYSDGYADIERDGKIEKYQVQGDAYQVASELCGNVPEVERLIECDINNLTVEGIWLEGENFNEQAKTEKLREYETIVQGTIQQHRDEISGISYIESNGHYVVDGDMMFRNKLELIGQDASGKRVQYTVLTNDSDVTWEKVDKKYHSDGFDNELSGTVVVDVKIIA